MADLASLKKKTESLTVLYVEDSAILMKKMTLFLAKLFKTVYQAENGIEGLQVFQNDKPDIVITDIDMPEMNGHEMMKAIKKLDPDSKIIVYSAYADADNLLEAIHAGVVDFIPKPVDLDLFEKVLTKVVDQIDAENKCAVTPATNTVAKVQHSENDQEEIFKQLEIIKRSHKNIEFVNHYRGVPIYDHGKITVMDHKSITVEVPFLQKQIIKYEKTTVMISELFEHTLEAKLERVNSHNNTVVLTDLQYLEDKTQRRKSVCVEPNNDFSCIVTFNETNFKSSVVLLSTEFITLNIELEEKIELIEGNNLQLQFLIRKQIDKSHVNTVTLELKGELYFMDKADNKSMKVMLLLEVDPVQKEKLEEYISLRRKELITEFKQMKD